MNVTDRATAKQAFDALTATGAKPPKPVLDAWQQTSRLTAAVRDVAAPPYALAVAVAAALGDGRDPAADQEVQRVLTASQIANHGIIQAVDDLAYDRLRDVCRTQADAIVEAFRKPFDQAVDVLVRAHEQLGPVPLDDTDAVLRAGGDSGVVWGEAQIALTAVTTVTAGWSALGSFTRLALTDSRHTVLRMTAPDIEVVLEHGLDRARLSPWECLGRGLRLNLPTFTEYAESVAALEHDRRQQQAEGVIDHGRSHIAGREIRVPAT